MFRFVSHFTTSPHFPPPFRVRTLLVLLRIMLLLTLRLASSGFLHFCRRDPLHYSSCLHWLASWGSRCKPRAAGHFASASSDSPLSLLITATYMLLLDYICSGFPRTDCASLFPIVRLCSVLSCSRPMIMQFAYGLLCSPSGYGDGPALLPVSAAVSRSRIRSSRDRSHARIKLLLLLSCVRIACVLPIQRRCLSPWTTW